MPKGAPFAEGLSVLEYQRLIKARPYVQNLVINDRVNFVELRKRLKQPSIPITEEEGWVIERVKNHLKKTLHIATERYSAFKGPNWIKIAPENSKENIMALRKGAPIPPIDKGVDIASGLFIKANQQPVNLTAYLGDEDSITRENVTRINDDTSKDQYEINYAWPWHGRGVKILTTKGLANLARMARDSRGVLDEIDAGVKNVNAYQAEQAKKAAEAQAEKDKRIKQLEAQKASYEKDAAFKKTEFEKALAAQKASEESTRKQMLANFEAQKNNIRTDAERLRQEALAQRAAELQKQKGSYESRLSASAAELQKQKIMYEDKLTARTIELEKQRASYEAQLAARAAEEAKRKQDAEAFQSQLRRKLNIYERGRVGFNFVGTNTPNTQIKGTKIGATKGGRYVAGRIRYDKNGMAVYDTDEGTPDLFLQMIGIAKKMRK